MSPMLRLCPRDPLHLVLDDSRTTCPCGGVLEDRAQYERRVRTLNVAVFGPNAWYDERGCLKDPCIATIVEMSSGPLILMARPATAECPRCNDARERRRLADEPKPTSRADAATSQEEA